MRLIAMRDYLPIVPGNRVFDVGCGPGHIVEHLPKGIEYHGFDTNARYIQFAAKHFGHIGNFHCCWFDGTAKESFGSADFVMLNGVLHHLSDDDVMRILSAVRKCLQPGGLLFTLDGCFRDGQSRIARWIHANDRGEFVRTEPEYRALLAQVFPNVQAHIREDISFIPHTTLITLSGNKIT